MLSLLLSILVFVGAVCCHVIVHRLLVRLGIVTTKTIIVYVIGFLVLAVIVRSMTFPVTSLWFYTLLVVSHLLYFLSFLSDAQSPSAKLLQVVKERGPLDRRAILTHFSNDELIGMRLQRLIGSGLLDGDGGRLHMGPGGSVIAGFFGLYRKLLQWDDGG